MAVVLRGGSLNRSHFGLRVVASHLAHPLAIALNGILFGLGKIERQDIDSTAFCDRTLFAAFDHARELVAQSLEINELGLNLGQLRAGNSVPRQRQWHRFEVVI